MKNRKQARYLNLLTDFGFKRIFAQDECKPLLIHLLNAIFGNRVKIKDILYLQTEQLGKRKEERRAIYDIYCKSDRGERLIIEMQVGKQMHFMDRSLYYTTFSIQAQAKKGKWDYKLKPVFHIAITTFTHDESNNDYINYYSLLNEKGHNKINDNLIFITVELSKFKKTLKELENDLDAWMYCFCNLPEMEERPAEIKGAIFDQLFELVDMNNLTSEEMEGYKKSVAEYADVQLMMECSLHEGREEGREEGMQKGLMKGIMKGRREGMLKGIQRGRKEGKMQGRKEGKMQGRKEGKMQGRKEGKMQGKKEGKMQGKKESVDKIARNLLKMKFSMSDIAKITGLSADQIQQL
jgi:predicted transposase/invertase (TIGR01784 family)